MRDEEGRLSPDCPHWARVPPARVVSRVAGRASCTCGDEGEGANASDGPWNGAGLITSYTSAATAHAPLSPSPPPPPSPGHVDAPYAPLAPHHRIEHQATPTPT